MGIFYYIQNVINIWKKTSVAVNVELYTIWFSLVDVGSVRLFVSELVDTLNNSFVLLLEKMSENFKFN